MNLESLGGQEPTGIPGQGSTCQHTSSQGMVHRFGFNLRERRVEPELLDSMPPEHALAKESRDDLARLNAWMGNATAMARALKTAVGRAKPTHLCEIGAGDGRFALRVAQRMSREWGGTCLWLIDRQPAVSSATHKAFEVIGWRSHSVHSDVFQWLEHPAAQEPTVLLANLFLHHFTNQELQVLFCRMARRSGLLIALEPRRSLLALCASLLVGGIGCNRVTRHDAPISVRAGFRGSELSSLWPEKQDWTLSERRSGLFAHLFIARRRDFASERPKS